MGACGNVADTVVIAMVTGVKYRLYGCEVDELEPLDVITSYYMKCIVGTLKELILIFEGLKKQLDELEGAPQD